MQINSVLVEVQLISLRNPPFSPRCKKPPLHLFSVFSLSVCVWYGVVWCGGGGGGGGVCVCVCV